jgi:hypothetical protein
VVQAVAEAHLNVLLQWGHRCSAACCQYPIMAALKAATAAAPRGNCSR